jgi:hypothetical protein
MRYAKFNSSLPVAYILFLSSSVINKNSKSEYRAPTGIIRNPIEYRLHDMRT